MKKFHVNKKFKENKELCQKYAQINKVHPEGNRKTRRMKKSVVGRAPRQLRDFNHWYKRIAKEMQQNIQVQDLILSGKVDKLLE